MILTSLDNDTKHGYGWFAGYPGFTQRPLVGPCAGAVGGAGSAATPGRGRLTG